VGASSLQECLLIQLKRKNATPEILDARRIVEICFDEFSRKHYDKIERKLELSKEAIRLAIEEIVKLNPKPGSVITGNDADDRSRHIIPDFNVEVEDDAITLTLLNNIPELQIEATFSGENNDDPMPENRWEREAMVFVKQKRDEAKSFIQVLKMRQETLYRVMSAIVKIQREFFLTEDESLIRPMILKDIAAQTGYDLSVISRATAGKYVATARGIYPLKLFFNERPKDDDDTSFHEIQAVLKEIIAGENKKKPLSDEAITAELVNRGYDIARCTVAKYRERMGLPVARLRKEL
jgi:RNA polymerase sigma-54 factor